MKHQIESPVLTRAAEIPQGGVRVEARTVDVVFSTETEVERWFGKEVLDHTPRSVRLDRIRASGPFLVNHSVDDQVGVVESARIEQGKGRATLRLGNSSQAGEILQDIADGIRKHISVGYRIHKMVLERESDEEGAVYRATDWEPYEISSVGMPADLNAGVGRAFSDEQFTITIEDSAAMSETTQQTEQQQHIAADASADSGRGGAAPAAVTVFSVNNAVTAERKRIADLEALGERYAEYGAGEVVAGAKRSEMTVAQAKELILEKLPQARAAGGSMTEKTTLGMSDKETQRYSLMRAIRAAVAASTGDHRSWAGEASFEREVSDAISDRLDKPARGFYVPYDVQRRELDTRVMNVTTGANIIATEHLASSFIELLRANAIVIQAGARVLDDLQGNLDIPKQTGGATFAWLDDDGDVSNTDLTLGNVPMTPKTVAGSVPISRRLLKQSSPAIDDLVQADLAQGAALAIDAGALEGDGTSNAPSGITDATGVNTQTVTTPGAPTWPELVGFETALGTDNALMGRLAYAVTPAVRGTLKTTAKDSGSGLFLMEGGEANGYMVYVSTQLAASRLIFGNFADVVIGMWGVLDVMPDLAAKAAAGGLVLRVFQDVDIAVRHAESFCINA